MKLLFFFIFLFCDSDIVISNESKAKAESFLPEVSYFQKSPFYFLKTIPSSIKLFSGTDLSFFRDQSIVARYRYRIDIPSGSATAIDRSLTRWSPWLSFDFIEIVIPVLDLEGGYKLIIEYKKNKSDEILRFEKVFYVYRLNAGYAGEPPKIPTLPSSGEKKIQTPASVQKTPDKIAGPRSAGKIPVKTAKKREDLSLEKVTLNPRKIDLLKLYANIKSYNDLDYHKLLEEALEKKNVVLVRNSILNGAGSDIRVMDGGNIFHLLNDSISDDEVIHVLMSNGISLNETDDNGNSPLHLAILTSQNKYARLLINQGADLNLKNKLDLSPLHLASLLDNRTIAGELIINGAEVNIRGNTGYTPLHIASELNHLNLAGDLLLRGANPNLKTFQGLKTKEIAKIQKSREMSRLLGGRFEILSDASESNSSQTISYIRTSRLNPKYEFSLPYDDELVKKRQFNKIIGMISIPVFIISSSGIALFKSQADSYYSLYRNAETIDLARLYYDKTLKYDTFTYLTGGVSLISVYGIIHSAIRKKSIDNRMHKLFY